MYRSKEKTFVVSAARIGNMCSKSYFARFKAKHGGLTYPLSTILSLILTSVLFPSPGKSARSVTLPAANERKLSRSRNKVGKRQEFRVIIRDRG